MYKAKSWKFEEKQINPGPAKLVFDQNKIRTHLISCLTQQQCSNFPSNIDTNWKKKKIKYKKKKKKKKQTILKDLQGGCMTAKLSNVRSVLNGIISDA